MLPVLALALGTFVSEDLACVTAGLLIQRGAISPAEGIAGCALGIFLGDCGLWSVGRLAGNAALRWRWIARRFPDGCAEHLRWRLERHAAGAIVASRFLPGTRLPLYVLAGLVKMSGARFALWTFVAVVLWTPGVVLFAAWSGAAVGTRLPTLRLGASLAAASVPLLLLYAGRTLSSAVARRRAAARLARWRRWEFWPMWLFYGPVAVWIAWLAIRHRGLSTITAANPGIPDGGVVGESKFEILTRLPADCTIPAALILPGVTGDRVTRAAREIRQRAWRFPVVLKPDVGQRGVGVKLVRDIGGLTQYLARIGGPVLVQPYDEGPFEAGVFYYRMPGWNTGRILSITDKCFPVLVGDGRSTVEALILAHPRYRLQATLFLKRHAGIAARVLGPGERLQLAIAGNHAQGTLFRDGWHLWTPALEQRIDDIARAYPGFFVGRFDVRYRRVEDFKGGRDLAIVELNGATAESTNIYDPSGSLLAAYRQLFRQWSIVFAIGALNRASGAPITSTRRLFGLVRTHLTTPVAFAIAD